MLSLALKGRRIPAPLQGATIDCTRNQGVSPGWYPAALSAPKTRGEPRAISHPILNFRQSENAAHSDFRLTLWVLATTLNNRFLQNKLDSPQPDTS
jgi:hypothetical protein